MRRRQPSRRHADRRRFADLVTERLRRHGVTGTITYDGDRFALQLPTADGTQHTLPLSDLQAAYRETPPNRRVLLLDRELWGVAGSLQIPDTITSEEGRQRLLPRVRSRVYYDFPDPNRVKASVRPSKAVWPYRLLAEQLAVGLVCDYPIMAVGVDEDMLADWGLSVDEAFLLAERNLRARQELPFQSPRPGVFVSAGQDEHDATYLWLTDVVRQHEVRGAYVACVPCPGLLVVSGLEEPVGLPTLLDAAEAAFERDRPVSGLPVCWHEGSWQPLQLPPGHPESRRLRWLHIRSLAADYGTQGRALNTTGLRVHDGRFVSNYFPVWDRRSGEPESYCMWTQKVPALLPRTTLVRFNRPTASGIYEDLAEGTWERVRQVAGPLLQPLGVYPERFRVDVFPTDEQLAAIGPPTTTQHLEYARGWQPDWPGLQGGFVGQRGP